MSKQINRMSLSKRYDAPYFTKAGLATIPLFEQLDPQTLIKLSAQLKRKTYKHREVIFHTGDLSKSLYIICSGKVKLTQITDKGEEALLTIIGERNYFGEAELIDGSLRGQTATSVGASEVIVLPISIFQTLLETNAAFSTHVLNTSVHRLRKMNEQINDIYFRDLPSRLSLRLLELVQNHGAVSEYGLVIDVYLTQSDIAEMCGATRVSVNKILGEFRRNGWISTVDRRFVIVDLLALKQFVRKRAV